MAIVVTARGSYGAATNIGNGGTFATGSFTPSANSLLLAFIGTQGGPGTASNGIASLSGHGTWAELTVGDGPDVSGNDQMLEVWWVKPGSSPGASAVTATNTTQTKIRATMSVFEITGIDDTAAIGDIILQCVEVNQGTAGTSGSVTLASFADATNNAVVIGVCGARYQETIAWDSPLNSIHRVVTGTELMELGTAYDVGEDTSPGFSWGANNRTWRAMALEVAAASTAQDLGGSLFQKAPTFFTGAVTAGAVDLAGALHDVAPTFFTGTVGSSYPLSGALHAVAPSFFAGAVAPGAVDLSGSLFQKAPTFFAGAVEAIGPTQGIVGTGRFDGHPTAMVIDRDAWFVDDINGLVLGRSTIWPTEPVSPPLTVRPSFFSGTVENAATEQSLTGALFQKAPTFFAGAVTVGSVDLAGTLHDVAPTFFAGTIAAGAVDLSGALFQNGPTFSTGTVSPGAVDLSGSLFQTAPTFFTGTVAPGAVDLAGTLFDHAPTFFVGAVSADAFGLVGTLFQVQPTFFAGTVAGQSNLTGVLFQKAPTFFAGAVTPGAVSLVGTLFQNGPTFPTGTVGATYAIAGQLFAHGPTFGTGSVTTAYELVGTLFQHGPTFSVGAVQLGDQAIAGTLFQVGPGFFVGTVGGGLKVRLRVGAVTAGRAMGGVTAGRRDVALASGDSAADIDSDRGEFAVVGDIQTGSIQ